MAKKKREKKSEDDIINIDADDSRHKYVHRKHPKNSTRKKKKFRELRIDYRVLDDKNKEIAILKTTVKKMDIISKNKLFLAILKEPLEKGISCPTTCHTEKGVHYDEAVIVKKFNALNFPVLEEYLIENGYTVEVIK